MSVVCRGFASPRAGNGGFKEKRGCVYNKENRARAVNNTLILPCAQLALPYSASALPMETAVFCNGSLTRAMTCLRG